VDLRCNHVGQSRPFDARRGAIVTAIKSVPVACYPLSLWSVTREYDALTEELGVMRATDKRTRITVGAKADVAGVSHGPRGETA
jgi:hypothetical protein